MLGTIAVADLEIRCIVGIHPHERVEPQTLFLDVEIDHDFARAADSGDTSHTVDYSEMSEALTLMVQEGRFHLMEALAERGCRLIFERWPSVTRCRITVKKPAALPAARYAAVRVERLTG